MKTKISLKNLIATVAAMLLLTVNSFAQLAAGGINAGFGIDADTKSNYSKLGPSTGSNIHDDWFSPAGTGRGVIDTTNAAVYKALLQTNQNISFVRRMSAQLNSTINGRLWQDAVYSRDFQRWPAVPGMVAAYDSTAFIAAGLNGDDPINWRGGTAGAGALPDKNDFTDVYMHMRRNGVTINDSLWLTAAVATNGTLGDRHLDVELFKNTVTYSRATGRFSTGGPDSGHVQWLFDASGNIIQTGDMIITMSYTAAGVITVEPRIWVSKITHTTVIPSLFNFGIKYNGKTTLSTFGYANIVSKAGTQNFGSAIGNFSATPANDTTFNTPWGSRTTVGANMWAAEYQSLQYLEFAVNLSRVGVDPALYSILGNAECDGMFKSILFKSRSANAFTASIQDFVGPLDFMAAANTDYTVRGDSISCSNPTGNLLVTTNTTAGHFNWTTTAGNIVSSTADSTNITINRAGTYILQGAVANGCPVTRRDTLRVVADSSQPVATANVGSNGSGQTQLFGGDPVASNYATPFGGSQGLTWSWTGPNGFTSTLQDPIIGSMDIGNYTLLLTEQRNGCRDTAIVYYNFSLLASNDLVLRGSSSGKKAVLNWKNLGNEKAIYFEIEQRVSALTFVSIAKTIVNNEMRDYSYTDVDLSSAGKTYRVKMVTSNGKVYYSNNIMLQNKAGEQKDMYFTRNTEGTKLFLVINTKESTTGAVAIYNTNGSLLKTQPFSVSAGRNSMEVSGFDAGKNKLQIVTVYVNNRLALTEKIIH